MKDKLKATGHIIAIIIIYLMSFFIPVIISNLFDFKEQIDFFRIIIQSLIAIIVFISGTKLYVERVMTLKLSSLRVRFKKPDYLWVIAAIIVPSLIILFYLITGKVAIIKGNSDTYNTIRFFTHIIFVGGLCAGIVEEILFRGIIFGFIEKKYGLITGIIISSLLFGIPHLLNINSFSLSLIIQTTVFISLYGAIMSMIVYHTDNIWNSISIHIFWNIITSLIINQGEDIKSNFVLQMKDKSLFWNGGNYGLEISIVGLIGFSIFGFLILILKEEKVLHKN